MPPQQVNVPPPIQPEPVKPVSFFERKIVWISAIVIILLGGGSYFLMHQSSYSQTGSDAVQIPANTTASNANPENVTVASGSQSSDNEIFFPGDKLQSFFKTTDCGTFALDLRRREHDAGEGGKLINAVLYYLGQNQSQTSWLYLSSYPPLHQDFLPLPTGTKVETKVFELPKYFTDASSPQYDLQSGGVPLVNIFVDPAAFSEKDFQDISACFEKHLTDLNSALGAIVQSPLHFGGVAYISRINLQKLFESKADDFTDPTRTSDLGIQIERSGLIVDNNTLVGDIFTGLSTLSTPNFSATDRESYRKYYQGYKDKNGLDIITYVNNLKTSLTSYFGK